MLSEKIASLLQERINVEEQSARLYLAMSQWLDYHGYIGAAKLWKKYYEEELDHASWAYQYLQDKDVMPIVATIESLETSFSSLPEIVKASYEHELFISKQCNDLAIACHEEQDYITNQLADKYLKEQIEEEAKFLMILDRIDAFGEDKVALRLLDNELGCKA